jgi:hypothetical protein
VTRKREASLVMTKEQMDWLRFAVGQLDLRRRECEEKGLRTGARNCKAAMDACEDLIDEWRAA